ncbi:MAG: class I SAM-dependent methyltransferase [Chloroflexota bacterium]
MGKQPFRQDAESLRLAAGISVSATQAQAINRARDMPGSGKFVAELDIPTVAPSRGAGQTEGREGTTDSPMATWQGDYRAGWEAEAAKWTAYARQPELDFFFWSFNLPSFLEFMPAPGQLTLDVGCGEGRLARELHRVGHTVLAIDGSPTLARVAYAAEPLTPVVVADAARLPVRDESADIAVAFMVYMDVDALDDCVKEASRVLKPGGRLCLAILHPAHSWQWDPEASYFQPRYVAMAVKETPLPLTLHTSYRPLTVYFAALNKAGLLVEAIYEPIPTDSAIQQYSSLAKFRGRPSFLYLRAIKQ